MAMVSPPFPKEKQLCDDLEITGKKVVGDRTSHPKRNTDSPTLPGQPTLGLNNLLLLEFLKKDLLTPRLNEMASYLWLVAIQSHTHVSPLHHQAVRGRKIILTENPELHLLWMNDRVFIKPVPLYLMSHAFWQGCFHDRSISQIDSEDVADLHRASLGFMRSWYHLVRHESDFRIAKEHYLLPDVEWNQFIIFISHFAAVADQQVSPRYTYGYLRLGRLNGWIRIILRRGMFQKVHGSSGAYFAEFYGPILFTFALFSTVLSAMQVVLASNDGWSSFVRTSKWFSVTTLFCAALVGFYFITVWVIMLSREAFYASRKILLSNRHSS